MFVISSAVFRFALDNETIKRIAGIFLAGAIFTMLFGILTLIADRAGERMKEKGKEEEAIFNNKSIRFNPQQFITIFVCSRHCGEEINRTAAGI